MQIKTNINTKFDIGDFVNHNSNISEVTGVTFKKVFGGIQVMYILSNPFGEQCDVDEAQIVKAGE